MWHLHLQVSRLYTCEVILPLPEDILELILCDATIVPKQYDITNINPLTVLYTLRRISLLHCARARRHRHYKPNGLYSRVGVACHCICKPVISLSTSSNKISSGQRSDREAELVCYPRGFNLSLLSEILTDVAIHEPWEDKLQVSASTCATL